MPELLSCESCAHYHQSDPRQPGECRERVHLIAFARPPQKRVLNDPIIRVIDPTAKSIVEEQESPVMVQAVYPRLPPNFVACSHHRARDGEEVTA